MRVLLLLTALAGTAMSQCVLTALTGYTTDLDTTFDALGLAKSGELYTCISGTSGGGCQGSSAVSALDITAGDGDVACASGKSAKTGATLGAYACATTTWTEPSGIQCCTNTGCTTITSCTDQTVANTVCAAAAAGFWLNGNVATACTAIAGCTGGHTCTTASNQQCTTCGTNLALTDNTAPTADVCVGAAGYYNNAGTAAACTAISGCTGGLTCTSNANQQCTTCATNLALVDASADTCVGAAGYYNNGGTAAACTAISGCTAGLTCTTNANQQCTTCGANLVLTDASADTCVAAAGYWNNAGTAQACAVVANAASTGVTYTCTSAANTQMTGNCAAGYWKDTSGTADVCTACVAISNCADTAISCTSATTSQCTACSPGYWITQATADTCTACDAVAGCTQANIVCTSASDEKCHRCDVGYTLTVAAGTCGTAVTVPTNSGTPSGSCNSGYHRNDATNSASTKVVTAGTCATSAWVYGHTCVADAWATTCAAGTNLANGVCDGACAKAGAATYTANTECHIATCATGYTASGTGASKTCGADSCGTPTNANAAYGTVTGLTTGAAVAIPVDAGYVVATQALTCDGTNNLDMASLLVPSKITCGLGQYPDGAKGCTNCPSGLKLAAAKSAWHATNDATAAAGTAAGDCTVAATVPAHARVTTAASASTPTNGVVACYPGYTGTLTWNAATGAWDGTCAAYVPNAATCKTEATAHYYATQKAANLGQCSNPSTFTAPCATSDADMAACLVKLDAWQTAAHAKCDAFVTANTANAGYLNNLGYEEIHAAVIAATGLATYDLDTRYAALMTDGHVFHEAVETALNALSTKTVATYDSGEGVNFYNDNTWAEPAGTTARLIANMSIRDLIAMAVHETTIATAIDALTPANGAWEANDDAALEAIRAAITAAATPTAVSSGALASAGVVALAVGAAQLFM